MIRRIPKFNKVLFCLPLRCGVITLVYCNILIAAAACVCFGFLDIIKAITRMFTMHHQDQVHRVYRSKMNPTVMLLALLVYILCELAMTVVALVGIHKPKQTLVKHYLYFNVGVTVYILFTRMFDVNHFHWHYDALAVLVYSLLKLYHILCVRSFLKASQSSLEPTHAGDVEMDNSSKDLCEDEDEDNIQLKHPNVSNEVKLEPNNKN